MPLELHSDQGWNMDGEVMREVCNILGIRKMHTTPYHPQGNAITERENAVIKGMLAVYVNSQLTDWDKLLAPVMMVYHSSVHRTLDETPNAMMLGREVRLPIDSLVGLPPEADFEV
jgi:transposase InsO family protein